MSTDDHKLALKVLSDDFDDILSDLIGTVYSWTLFKHSAQNFGQDSNAKFVELMNRNAVGGSLNHLQDTLHYDAIMRLCRMTEHDTSERAGRMTIFSLCKKTEMLFNATHQKELQKLRPLKRDIKNYAWLAEARQFRDEYLAHSLRKREGIDGPEYKYIEEMVQMIGKLLNVVASIIGQTPLPKDMENINKIDLHSQRLWMALENGLLVKEIVESVLVRK